MQLLEFGSVSLFLLVAFVGDLIMLFPLNIPLMLTSLTCKSSFCGLQRCTFLLENEQ